MMQVSATCDRFSRVGSEQTDPLKSHQTTIFKWMGFRMTPCNLYELIGGWFKQEFQHTVETNQYVVRATVDGILKRKNMDK